MRIVCISDVHNKISRLELPTADLLIVAGDLTNTGTMVEYAKFNSDLEKIKKNYKFGIVVIEGNHDWLGEKEPGLAKALLTNATLLRHESIIINEVSFFGSPFTPYYGGWSFNVHRGQEIKEKWDTIPNGIDVLITHGPPYKILDLTDLYTNEGCKDLLEATTRIKPKLHVFGHIHHSYGVKKSDGITFINASSCDENNLPVNKPIEIEI